MWTLFSVIVVFVLSTGVQSQELTDVTASDISKQIENLLMSTGVQSQELTDVPASDISKQIENLLMSTGVQSQELTEVSASEILEKIRKGKEVAYDNVSITGKLDLSKINLTTVPNARSAREIEYYGLEKELKIVESNITIQDSVFGEDVDFSNTEFRKNIDFIGTSFSNKSDFSGANFARDAYFRAANFARNAKFNDTNFTGDAIFGDANFTGGADFLMANFADLANFGHANFTGYAIFWDAIFTGGANFEDAIFTGYAYFVDANFDHNADFEYANFTGYAIFEDANFARRANFEDAVFTGDASFGDANFTGDASFENANFTGYATFMDANFAGYANFGDVDFTGDAIFTYTEFDLVVFTWTTFTNVYLIETDYNQMNVEWSTLKDALDFNGLAYIKLIKNFREMQQFEEADAAYYQYRRLSQKNKKWSDSSKLMDVVAWLSCGYGVKPRRPLIGGFILIIVFALVYKLGNGIRRLKLKENGDSRVSFWDAFYFSVTTFTTVGYGDWYPIDRYRIAVMIEGILGWLLLALFIVSLASVMIRP
jgi:uncharacterized protein YjbI with pentapeptide repeats